MSDDNNFYFDEDESQEQEADTKEKTQEQLDKERYESYKNSQNLQAKEINDNLVKKVTEKVTESFRSVQEEARQKAEQQALLDEYAQKYPGLTKHAQYIAVEVQQAQNEAAQQGKQLSYRELIDQGIKRFQERTGVQVISSEETDQLRRAAMSHDMTGAPPKPKVDGIESANLKASQGDFSGIAEIKAKVLRQAY